MYNVTLYTKDYCPYCSAAKSLLTNKGVSFDNIKISNSSVLKAEMIKKSNGGHTVPQVFIGDKHIGGATDLMRLEEEGTLDRLLKIKNVA
ncbi:MAG: glutaredoxin 3 [Emcibacteraceae bacterium]|nr:glutaredoxin 3 [Emcibacteraceae bacterium]